MLKKGICFCVFFLLVQIFAVNGKCLEEGDISASSAVLYYPATGTVLFEKNGYKTRSMASTTKIMTAVLALEECTPDRQVEITFDMVNVEGTSSGLREGDIISLKDLVYCMLLESGNDAANSVALALAGSFEAFAEMMNEKARQTGMENSSFVTPSGLDAEMHYTTAYDMAILAAHAVSMPDFVSICSCRKYEPEFIASDKKITLYNHNRLLDRYEGCIGIKTGFTEKSGRCLVSAAERDGVVLIAVTLNAGDDWNDHEKMLDYGFSLVREYCVSSSSGLYFVPVTGGCTASVPLNCDDTDFSIIGNPDEIKKEVYLSRFLYAPVKTGDVAGEVRYTYKGKEIASFPLTVAENSCIKKEENLSFFDRLSGLFDGWWKNGR